MARYFLDFEFGRIDVTKLTKQEWARLYDIREIIKQAETIEKNDLALLMAFIAFAYEKSAKFEKKELHDGLH